MKPADPAVIKVVEEFGREVSKLLEKEAVAIVAFGSRVKGGYRPQSDYDLLLVYRRDREKAEEAAATAALNLSSKIGIGVEPIVISLHDFKRNHSYFVKRVRGEGFVYRLDEKGEVEKREAVEFLYLAEDFLKAARVLLKHGFLRAAVDEAYNTCELAVKALLLWSGKELPSSHGGLVAEFGRALVSKGRVKKEMGKDLSKSLEKGNRARYDPTTEITEEDAKFVLSTAEKLVKFASEEIAR
jgi:uncharacterized protein (UPF0332 family)/predicted nucleotidyltransferase